MSGRKLKFLHQDGAKRAQDDCYRTAIACLLNLAPEEVPHVYADPATTWRDGRRQMQNWLAERGLCSFVIAVKAENNDLQPLMEWMKDYNPTACFILMGTSKNGVNHSFAVRGGTVVPDHALDDSGIIAPANDGHFWLELLIPHFDPNAAMEGD